MAKKKNPYSSSAPEQHGAAKVIPNDPAPTVAQALKNSQAQVDKAKQ
jgi:hypothetical protein